MLVLVDYSRKLWKGSDKSLADLPHVVETISEIDELDELLENLKVECADFDVHPKRRKIIIVIDNYDAFSDESSRKKMNFFEEIAGLIRKYQTAGIFLLIAGSVGIMSMSDDLRKVITAPNFGIGLKSSDAVNRLNGKFPRSLADVELPMGRAFIVRSGITSMLQIATPYANDEDTEGSLDTWVTNIVKKYKKEKVGWLRVPPEKGEGEEGQSGTTSGAGFNASDYDLPAIKQKLIENGMPETLLDALSPADIVENAKALGLLDQPKAAED